MFIHPTNLPFRSIQQTAETEVDWIRNVEENIQPTDCLYLQPGESCYATLELENKGNYDDQFTIEVLSCPEFISSADVLMETIGIPRYGTVTTNVIQINIDENAIAYTQGKVYFQLKYDGSSVIESYEVEVLVGPNVNWTFLDANSEVDSKNSLSFSVQLRNDGNLNDGLIVQLQSSHSTDMGFNLPEGAIVEDGVENPRTFEIDSLPRDSNFTVSGTAEIPIDQIANGTLVLDIVVRSIFDPETEFIYTIEYDFLGENWIEDDVDDSYSFSDFTSDVYEIFMGWWLVIAAVAVASVVLNKAVRDRMQRKELEHLQKHIEQPVPEEQGDWMEKFERKDTTGVDIIESPHVSPEDFTAAFKASSKPPTQPLEPLSEDIRNMASTVLDHHALEAQKAHMDELASSIQSEGISKPHNENLHLRPAQDVAERTIRHDTQNLMSNKPSTMIPLPLEDNKEDEFDL